MSGSDAVIYRKAGFARGLKQVVPCGGSVCLTDVMPDNTVDFLFYAIVLLKPTYGCVNIALAAELVSDIGVFCRVTKIFSPMKCCGRCDRTNGFLMYGAMLKGIL